MRRFAAALGCLAICALPATASAAAPTVTASAASCGNTSFRLALRGIAKARLRCYGGVRLRAKVSFTPSGGSTYEEEVAIGIGLRRRPQRR